MRKLKKCNYLLYLSWTIRMTTHSGIIYTNSTMNTTIINDTDQINNVDDIVAIREKLIHDKTMINTIIENFIPSYPNYASYEIIDVQVLAFSKFE